MEVKFADTFFDSLKKLNRSETWYMKTIDLLRYDLPNFFRNLYNFRKELWGFRGWDHNFNERMFKRTLELTADCIEHHGNEVEDSRMKKVVKMRRAIQILNNHTEDLYISMAEKELNAEVVSGFDFVPCEDNPELCEMKDTCTPEQNEMNSKIFSLSDKMEKEEWEELWNIIKGQDKCPEGVEWDDHFDGSGLKGWWD